MGRILMYEVICSTAFPTKDGWIASGELLRVKMESAEQAVWLAAELCKAGRSVVLRPDFNESTAARGGYFREWRSINGEELREVRWEQGKGSVEDSGLVKWTDEEPANAVVRALRGLS